MQYSEMLLSDGNKLKPKLESQLHRFRPTYFKDYTDKDHGVHLVCIDDVDFYTDDDKEIIQKYRGKTPLNLTHCENKLYNQFGTGIDTNQPVMIVLKDGSRYKIISGNHRLYMLKTYYPDVTHFPMQIIESKDHTQIAIVGLAPNRTNPNVLKSGEEHVVKTGSDLVESGDLEATKKAIRSFVLASDRYASEQSKKNMVAQIIKMSGVNLTFRSITDGSVDQFYKEYNYKQNGSFATFKQDGDTYHGTVATQGYLSNRFFKALQRYLESGISTLVDGYVSDRSLTKYGDNFTPEEVNTVRAEILDEYAELKDLFQVLINKILAGQITELDDIMKMNGFIAQLKGQVRKEDTSRLIDIFDSEIQAIFQDIRKEKAEKKEKQRLAEAQSDQIQDCVTAQLDDFLKTG